MTRPLSLFRQFRKTIRASWALVGFGIILLGVILWGLVQSWQAKDFVWRFADNHPNLMRLIAARMLPSIVITGFLLVIVLIIVGLWRVAEINTVASASEAGLALSTAQLEVAREQNRLVEAQLQPVFRFVTGRRTVGGAQADFAEIWNDGAPINELTIWQGSYIAVTRSDLRPLTTRYLASYYFGHRSYEGDAKTGLLVTFGAWRQNAWEGEVNLTEAYERLEAEARELDITIEKKVFLEIYYSDRSGKQHHVVYEIYPPRHDRDAPAKAENLMHGMVRSIDLAQLHGIDLLRYWDSNVVDQALPVVRITS